MSDRGIYRLATAVLVQAIQDVASNSIGRCTGALRWIISDQDSCYSFTFICRVLNRDPDQVRRLCLNKAWAGRMAGLPFRNALRTEIN
ncbi:MAG: hypothetical protein HY238_26035 [Acidobacteria bacterium]|nr:hypothetical protein [Acidobacteriota bacterium]